MQEIDVLVDLVQVTTRDGLRLDGAFETPQPHSPEPTVVDAIICVHGTGGSFYSSSLFEFLAGTLLRRGIAVLRVNTRGHDLVSTAASTGGARRQGAAYERVDECRHDLAAWIDWLASRNHTRIGLLGHSLGAVKVLYAQAHEPHRAVQAVLAVSPPRLSHSMFRASSRASEFLDAFTTAQQHVQAGQPDTLLEVQTPLPYLITAGGYIEKYGPDERYNFLHFVQRIQQSILFTFGGKEIESHMAFHGVPEELGRLDLPAQPLAGSARRGVNVEVVAGADHFYTGTRELLAERILAWLEHQRAGT